LIAAKLTYFSEHERHVQVDTVRITLIQISRISGDGTRFCNKVPLVIDSAQTNWHLLWSICV